MAYFSKEDKQRVAPKIKAVLKKYGVKGTISVNDCVQVVVKLKKGPFDFGEQLKAVYAFGVSDLEEKAQNFIKELDAAMNDQNYNDSEAQIDYFDVGWYSEIRVGGYYGDSEYVKEGN